MIKVSVIIPVFNTEKYISKCLSSLVNQTLDDIEIICVNDGSTDNSLEIIEKIANNDARIKIINQEHKKQGAARNAGLKIAEGEYIGFVDSDDWIDLNYYEMLYNTAKKYDALMEFENVCFNYSFTPDEKSFIKDLSFKIMPNQTIGIIGGTGSGKSTLAHLMTRFYDVTSGEIKFKGKNVKDYDIKNLRQMISIVQQRSTLFSGSLRENMQIRKSNATDEEIIEALKISQAWSFVSEWKNGLDYQIMAGGKNVSGGQMQRLTIARAIIGNPELLIFDDSSSALDFLTESKLMKEIKKMDCARVIISQRATSIKNADLIICLDNGDVVGIGKHNDLMKNCEIYREIYESQSK